MTDRTDNFNRADTTNNIGTPSDGGSAWVQWQGTWGINGNAGYESAGTAQAVCALESTVADVDVQGTISIFGGDTGLCGRLSDANNYLLLAETNATMNIYKCVAGGFTSLASQGSLPFDATTPKLSMSGSSVSGYLDGVLKLGPVTETFNQTSTKHGLRMHVETTTRWDNFSITANGGATFNPGWAYGATRTIGMGVY